MAEKKPTTTAVAKTYSDVRDIATDLRAFNGADENAAFDAFDNLPDENLVGQTGDYYEFKENETVSLVAVAITTANYDGVVKPAVAFRARVNGEIKDFISSAAVLVSTCQRIEANIKERLKNEEASIWGVALRVKCGSKVKAKNGNYISMQISMLPS